MSSVPCAQGQPSVGSLSAPVGSMSVGSTPEPAESVAEGSSKMMHAGPIVSRASASSDRRREPGTTPDYAVLEGHTRPTYLGQRCEDLEGDPARPSPRQAAGRGAGEVAWQAA